MPHTAQSSDGTLVSYKLHGKPHADHRLVLIHSLAMNRKFWDPVIAELGDAFEVLTIDCRGHGASEKPAGPYTVEVFADDVAAVMDRIGWTTAYVAGASMGGCIALAFAGGHPERVLGLGLFDTTAWYGETAPSDWAGRAEKARAEGLATLVGFQQTRWFGDTFRAENPQIVDDAVEVFLQNDLEAYAETCNMLGRCDLRHVLADITVPVEIVVGSEDYATPVAMAEAMHEGIKDSSLEIIEGTRHLTPLEVPQQIAAALLRLRAR